MQCPNQFLQRLMGGILSYSTQYYYFYSIEQWKLAYHLFFFLFLFLRSQTHFYKMKIQHQNIKTENGLHILISGVFTHLVDNTFSIVIIIVTQGNYNQDCISQNLPTPKTKVSCRPLTVVVQVLIWLLLFLDHNYIGEIMKFNNFIGGNNESTTQ